MRILPILLFRSGQAKPSILLSFKVKYVTNPKGFTTCFILSMKCIKEEYHCYSRQVLKLSTAAKQFSGEMRQYKLRISAFLRWEALVPPSHHTLARWHSSKSSNLLYMSLSSYSSPSSCTSLTFKSHFPNNQLYFFSSFCFSYAISRLKTQWELHATKAGRFASRQLSRTPVEGSLRILIISQGKSFLSISLSTNERIFLAVAFLPERTERTEYTFSSSSSASSSSSSSYSSSQSYQSSSARTALPMVRLATIASATSELVVLVICEYLSRIVLSEWQYSSWISPTRKLTSICSPSPSWLRSISAFYDDSDSDTTCSCFFFPFDFCFYYF